jgi:hypothetical protein
MIDVRGERAFLAALEGGCQVPIGALAMRTGDERELHGFIGDVNGRRLVRGSLPLDVGEPELTAFDWPTSFAISARPTFSKDCVAPSTCRRRSRSSKGCHPDGREAAGGPALPSVRRS